MLDSAVVYIVFTIKSGSREQVGASFMRGDNFWKQSSCEMLLTSELCADLLPV